MNTDIYVVIEHLRGKVADISYTMLAAAQDLSHSIQGKVIAVLLGQNAAFISSQLAADQILYADHPALADFNSDAYLKVLSNVIRDNQPRAVLCGHTSIGMDIASGLSARLDLPLVTSVRNFQSNGRFVSQIYGGKIMVEGELPNPIALITITPGGYKPDQAQIAQSPEVVPLSVPELDDLRISLKSYIEPEISDIDISKEPILIAIGRGIQNQDNISMVEELAEALGGVVCASRPIIDQQWLPTSRLVGKSGKSIKPKFYIALGISGAPEHTEGILSSDVIVAVNTDPNAPIFNVAKYGIIADLFDIVPILTEQVQHAKTG
jgi:electron transfer flavoprotein alpha subunit